MSGGSGGRGPIGAGRRIPLPAVNADGSTRVTTFELFFDLVYVFAFTQVSRLMAETHSAVGVLQALIILSLMWWTWAGFSWISNQASADQPFLRTVMTLAMIAVFVAALTIPEAYDDLSGGWNGPLVFAGAYAAVRIIHVSLYTVVAAGDRALRRQLALFLVAMIPAVVLIFAGAALGGTAQIWLWLIAMVYDLAVTRIGSIGRRRLALAVGGALGRAPWPGRDPCTGRIDRRDRRGRRAGADRPVDHRRAAASVTLSVLLWWSYFARLAAYGEHALAQQDPRSRARLGADAYSYGHFVIIAGIILTALGIEDAMKHIGDAEPFGLFGATALAAGIATFAAGTVVFAVLVGLRRPVMRVTEALLVLAAIPLLAAVAPLVALVVAVALMGLVALIESTLHRRREQPQPVAAHTAPDLAP